MPGQTAYFAWKENAHPVKGETTFVSAGAGPVGSFVIQLVKLDGLRGIAITGSEEKVAFIKEIGVDVALDYKTEDTREVLEREGGIDLCATDTFDISGAYRSAVIMHTFARGHLQAVMKTEVEHGYPIGALSLCCAAIERALERWNDGVEDKKQKSFVENPWDVRAVGYLPGIKSLADSKWDKILREVTERMKGGIAGTTVGAAEALDAAKSSSPVTADLRSFIVLSYSEPEE